MPDRLDMADARTTVPAGTPRHLSLFTGIGPRLTHWRLDPERGELVELGALDLPANIQYAWPHPAGCRLYVASSDGGGRHGPPGDQHHITAVSVASDSGDGAALSSPGAIRLPSRPIHVTVDPQGRHVLAAFNEPAAVRVYRIGDDGSPGAEVPPAAPFDAGNYPHQIRVTPDGCMAVSTALGQNPAPGRPEDPGSLTVFRLADGQMQAIQTVMPDGGHGFGPRHLDFHPDGRWVYVSVERQNKLEMFTLDQGGLSGLPAASVPLLSAPQRAGVKQIAGAVHVHPNGRFVYAVNRASDTRDHHGTEVFAGGENTLAVFRIDPASGAPEPIQHVDTRGFHCRTFHIDSTGTWLVAAHITGLNVVEDGVVRTVPPRLSVFRIGDDGLLHFERALPMQTHGASMFWMGMVE